MGEEKRRRSAGTYPVLVGGNENPPRGAKIQSRDFMDDKFDPRRWPIGSASIPQPKTKSGDAYRLMAYCCDETGAVEWIWNSRDGVTPFTVRDKDGLSWTHVAFFMDVFVPFYVPPVGSRIFLGMTIERALEFADRRIARMLADPDYGERWLESQGGREATRRGIADSVYENGRAPDVATVDESLHLFFSERARDLKL